RLPVLGLCHPRARDDRSGTEVEQGRSRHRPAGSQRRPGGAARGAKLAPGRGRTLPWRSLFAPLHCLLPGKFARLALKLLSYLDRKAILIGSWPTLRHKCDCGLAALLPPARMMSAAMIWTTLAVANDNV